MLTGSDLRRYRKLLGLSQMSFARELGVAQATISQIEAGRISLSDDHLANLAKKFKAGRFRPTFDDFRRQLEKGLAAAQPALGAPHSRYSTLVVWSWDDGFDLGRVPGPEAAVDLVTVRATEQPAIALKFGRRSDQWVAGEIIVFERCGRDELGDGELCLVQTGAARRRPGRTIVAVARAAPIARGRELRLEPITPSGPLFIASDENLIAALRAIYRGRRVQR